MNSHRDAFVSVRAPKTAELVASQLRARIVRGELKEGETLPPETVLLAELGVSRPTLREAFRILESEALVTVRRGLHGGAFVHAPSGSIAAQHVGLMLQYHDTRLVDVYEAKRVLELAAVRMLAKGDRGQILLTLEANLAETDAVADDFAAYLRLQQDFHHELLRLAGNQTIGLFAEMAYTIIDKQQQAFVNRAGTSAMARRVGKESAAAHRRFLDLLREGAFEQAEAVWDDHTCTAITILQGSSEAETVLDVLG